MLSLPQGVMVKDGFPYCFPGRTSDLSLVGLFPGFSLSPSLSPPFSLRKRQQLSSSGFLNRVERS